MQDDAHRSHALDRSKGGGLLVLGETTYRRAYHRFGILPEDRLRHLYAIGKTGTGKSTLLERMVIADIEAGRGCAVVDPHGSLVDAVLPFVPRRRAGDVLLLELEDTSYPVSWNPLRIGRSLPTDRSLMASQLISVFKKQWSGFWGPRLEHMLRFALLAVLEDSRATLLFLYRFLVDEALREKVVERVSDPVVRLFWQREFANYSKALQGEALAPVLNKLGAFVSHETVRRIIGLERSRIDAARLMDERSLILARLPTGAVGEDAAHLLGGLLVSSLQLGAFRREHRDVPFTLYIDEFQHVVNDSLAVMLAEARKFGLGLVLAHQYLGQVPESVRDAILGNVGSVIVFRVGSEDAELLERELAPVYTAGELRELPNHHIAVRLLVRGEATPPFSARTLPPLVMPDDGDARVRLVRQRSRGRFARLRADVDRQLTALLKRL